MPEVTANPPRSAAELRTLVQTHVSHLDPAWTVVAQELLGLDDGRIDLVALDGRGRVVVSLLGLIGEDDRALLTRLLAQRSWVARRVRDWAQLAPELELDPEARVRGVLMAPDFTAETRAAAASLGSESLELMKYTALQSGTRRHLLLSPLGSESATPFDLETDDGARYKAEPDQPVFRSGLTDLDLGLSGPEIQHFEGPGRDTPGGGSS